MHDQRREIGVRRHDAERVGPLGVEQLHRIDGHRHVGRVLALGIVELLHGAQRELQQPGLPALQGGLGPVAVGAADVDHAQRRQFGQDFVELVGGRVVRVDQQGNAQGRLSEHGQSSVGYTGVQRTPSCGLSPAAYSGVLWLPQSTFSVQRACTDQGFDKLSPNGGR
ncbi:hypothetical protein D3C78_1440860 [compost metagenome]